MNRTTETERLILRPLTIDDADDVFAWTGDAVVNRFMPYNVYTDVEAVKQWIGSIRPETHEFAFALKSTGKVIGSGSICLDEKEQSYTFGYNLNRAWWGQGYATEAARGMILWAWRELGARDFYAIYADANTASGHVIRKCGLTFVRPTTYSRLDGSETYAASLMTAHFDKEPYLIE